MPQIASSDFANYSWRQKLVNSEFSVPMLDDKPVTMKKEEMETLKQVGLHAGQQVPR